MKTFTRILLCFALLTVGKAVAQETFAPLVSENCIAFIHVDFSRVELDTVKGVLQKSGEDFLRKLGFDEKSFKATVQELNVELEKLDMLVRPGFATITKELGIQEFAVIFDMELALLGEGPGILAVPWKNKTEGQLEALKNLLLSAFDEPAINRVMFQAGDFLVVPLADNPEKYEQTVRGWLAKGTPKEPPIFEALKSVAGTEIKFAAAIPEQARLMIQNAPIPSEVPVEVRNLLLFAAKKIEWASTSVSLSNFLGTEPPENADVLLTVKTSKRSDAVMLRGMLEQAIEIGISAGRFAMEQESRNSDFQIPPLAFQFAKGLLRTLLPDIEEDKLVFRLKGESAASNQVVVATAGVGVALLLPAVQAGREAARRAQCVNNIKQIVLAIHCYHDATGVFPPLYTVDANGKPLHSWRVLLLPYLEQTALYEQIRLDEPWDSEHNRQFHNVVILPYACPSNPGGSCSYSAIAGEVFVPATKANSRGEHTLARITDGTSNTIAIVEVREPFCWMDPTADVSLEELVKGINRGRVGSYHTGGMSVGLFDGSVRFFLRTVDKETLRNAGKRDSGKPLMFP